MNRYYQLLVGAIILWVTLPLFAQNQTDTVSPVIIGGNLPYTVSVSQYDMGTSSPPAIQAFVEANDGNDWLLIAGRTNGLHGFIGTGLQNFPPDAENTVAYVIDPVTKQVWSRSLNDPSSGLTTAQVDELSSTAPQGAQQGNSLYVVGGYGYSNTTGTFVTFNTLTSINVSQAISWVQGGSGTLSSTILQTSSPLLQVTGGSLQFINGRANLIFGQNFDGDYNPFVSGNYTDQDRSFTIVNNGTSLALSDIYTSTPVPDNRRRDLDVEPILTDNGTQEGAVALAGVFTEAGGAWTVPVEIGADGNTTEADPNDPATFKQGMNGYKGSVVTLFSFSRNQSHIISLGGISLDYYNTLTATVSQDNFLPFQNGISSIVRSGDGTYQQYYLGQLPSIPNPANGNAPFLFGAEAEFLPSQDLTFTSNGMVDMDTLSASTPTLLGYMFGGIAAVQGDFGSSGASDVMFAVTYQPSPTIDLTGMNTTVGSLSGGNPTIISNNSPTAAVLSVGKGLTDADVFTYDGLIEDGVGTVGLNLLAGSLTLTNTNTYSGGTTVSGGTLVSGNTSAFGTGDFKLNEGVLVVGTTPAGTLHIGGNYSQGPASALVLTISSTSVYNTLTVAGTAQLGGGLFVDVESGFVPSLTQTFNFIEAAGGITGQFASVADNLITVPTLVSTLDFVNSGGVLTGHFVLNQLPFAPYAHTLNQASVARYIDANDLGVMTPAFTSVVAGLNNSSVDSQTLANAFDQLSPERFGNFARSTIFNNASFSTQQFDSYVQGLRTPQGTFMASDGGIDTSGLSMISPYVDPGLAQIRGRLLAFDPTAMRPGLLSDTGDSVLGGIDMKNISDETTTNPWDVFVQGNVILSQDYAQADLAHADSTTGAVQVGASYQFSPHWLAGMAFGYGHTNATLDSLGSKATINTYAPEIFASYANRGWYANVMGSYGFNNFTEDRYMNFGGFSGVAHGAPSGGQEIADLDGGYDFHVRNWTLGPTLGVQYIHFNIDSFSESGVPGADLSVDNQDSDSLRSRMGGHLGYAFKSGGFVFNPHLDASWQHEYLDQSRGITSQFSSVGAGSFVVDTPNPSRDSALVDLGLDAQVSGQVTVFVDYLAQAGQSNYFGQSVEAGVKIGF